MESANPYQTPTGDLATEDEGFGEVKFFSPATRVGRIRYLSHTFIFTLLAYVILIPGIMLIGAGSVVFGGLLSAIGYAAMLALILIVGIQRLHDLNHSGWFILLMFVPLANLALAVYMLFWPGSEGTNNYGKHPPPNKTWNWICGLFFPVLFVVGILAAIAIPAYQGYATSVESSDFYSEPVE